MRRGTRALGLALLGANLLLIAGALALPPSRTADIGAGRAPLLIGIVGAVLAILLVWTDRGANEAARAERGYPPRMLGFLLVCIGYLTALPLIGYVAATMLFAAAAVLVLEWPGGWRLAIVTALGFALFVFGLFRAFLSVPLP